MRRGLAFVVSCGLAAVPAFPQRAAGASSCTWTAVDATLTVSTDGTDTLAVDGAEILFNGTPCDAAATTAAVDTITITGGPGGGDGESFLIDLRGGDLAPGADAEGSGTSEIEVDVNGPIFVDLVMTPDDDVVSVGSNGVNLNADDDVDLTLVDVFSFYVRGVGGDDTVIGTGDPVVGGAPIEGVRAGGGIGDDSFVGGSSHDFFLGGIGRDAAIGGGGSDYLAGDSEADELDGGPGWDQLEGGDGPDSIRGGLGRDQLDGGRGADVLNAGDGADTLIGRRGPDRLIGGPGRDFVSYTFAPRGVHLNLLRGTATGGWGVDALISIEDARGSGHDDELVGSSAQNDLDGFIGDDTIRGLGGSDLLNGHSGDDRLYGGRGQDELFGDFGNDALYGGPGADVCVQLTGSGPEVSCQRR